jgi:hypothetical protein
MGKRKARTNKKATRDMGAIPLTRTTLSGIMLMLVTRTKILTTPTITSRNKGRTIIFRLTSLVHYVANMIIILNIASRL